MKNLLFVLLSLAGSVMLVLAFSYIMLGMTGWNYTAEKVTTCPCQPEPDKPFESAKLHICAFHIAKDDPNVQIETHHFCSQVNDELFQCLLYESPAKSARLLGVEYVVSDRVYNTLSKEEKTLWHPHEFEVKKGLLVAVGLPEECDRKTMKRIVKSWGKTWHTWPDPGTSLPLGRPRLMWSADKVGDIRPELIRSRDERLGISTPAIEKARKEFLP